VATRDSGKACFPRQLQAPPGAEGPFERVDDLYALHDVAGDPEATQALLVLAQGRVVVVRGDIATARRKAGPVYATPGGPLAVPTGRVFVRFRAGTPAAEKGDELEAAGYRIELVPGYAPHAAWVRAGDGTIASALMGLERLRGLTDVEHVETEMLMEKHSRGA
jgi:hypothetical protein